jgi:hypothetical protein
VNLSSEAPVLIIIGRKNVQGYQIREGRKTIILVTERE